MFVCLDNLIVRPPQAPEAPPEFLEYRLVHILCDSQVSKWDNCRADNLRWGRCVGTLPGVLPGDDFQHQSVEPGGADRLLRWRPVQRSLCLRPLPRPRPPAGAGHLLVLADSPQTVDRCFKLYDVH